MDKIFKVGAAFVVSVALLFVSGWFGGTPLAMLAVALFIGVVILS
jgi:hypothetical protein